MTAVWPASLPQTFNTDGYQEAIGDGLLRSPTDTGPGKVRRRLTAVPRPVSGQMFMTLAQLQTMMSFVNSDIQGGALPFTFPDQSGADGNISVPWLVMIGERMPIWTQITLNLWSVTLVLVIMP